MSVFGGDSWAREAQHRKRRVDDLMLSSSSSSSSSFKKLPNGKFACLVCPHNPILDSPLLLSMHNKGARHIAAESRLKERELSKQEELKKRIALSTNRTAVSNTCSSIQQTKGSEAYNKPLIEHTRQAILETVCNRLHESNAGVGGRATISITVPASSDSKIPTTSNQTNSSENISEGPTEASIKMLRDWNVELRKRQELELKFAAAGWKRDSHGKWYRDENVEFDSDEEDPNDYL